MSLEHANIIKCFGLLAGSEKIQFITEISTSGNLLDYLQKHVLSNNTAIKNWCRQILEGLDYLYTRNPPVIHRDVNLENMFISGDTGIVKLGNFSLAMHLGEKYSRHKFEYCRRTYDASKFIAPEVKEGEECSTAIDIYSFGMCVLQMVTLEVPYSEVFNKHNAHKQARKGVMPDALERVADPVAKQFIERCLVPAYERPTANELLDDPFLSQTISSPVSNQNLADCLQVVPGQVDRLLPKRFKLRGEITKTSTDISLTVCIYYTSSESVTNTVYSRHDTVEQLVGRIATEHGLSDEELILVHELMEKMIIAVRDSKPGLEHYFEITCKNRKVIEVGQVDWFRACLSGQASSSGANQ
ncbi:probable serine/threonine-protein kinase WNK11 [Spinacia oleracea]|uniref:non-specific serine/threonine protein kinase n=1 Tax=Spinacia oleracea TaxID=3562 RepID=A0A9R0J694_SPIOL|nr:probable serine/threonine-protein kinase WNK11 [Spinacia oleracea]